MAGPHTDYAMPGIANPTDTNVIYSSSSDGVCYYASNGYKYVGSAGSSAYGATFTEGDIIGMALNLVDDEITYYKNGVSQGAITGIPTPALWVAAITNPATSAGVFNFGQDSSFSGNVTAQGNQDENDIGDFYYTPPAGFLALCTSNLPDPAIALPTENFNTLLWTGDASSDRTVSGVGFQPDLFWMKSRNNASNYRICDSVRGDNGTRMYTINNNTTSAQGTDTSILSLTSDGFTTDNNAATGGGNAAGSNLVGWMWKAGGAASANTDGSLDSTVSANPTAGFSIVKYTGNSASAQTIGHGLSVAPELIIVKNLTDVVFWPCGTIYGGGWTKYFNFDSVEPQQDNTYFNDTAPTASVFSVDTNNAVNGNTNEHIAYCFHSVEGYSKVGVYTGNGSGTGGEVADGPFAYTGFLPEFVIIKQIDSPNEGWSAWDGTREPYNTVDLQMDINGNRAEYTANAVTFAIDFLSNGFKIRTAYSSMNKNALDYIYVAVAKSPFKTSTAR